MKQKVIIAVIAIIIILGAIIWYVSGQKAVAPENNNTVSENIDPDLPTSEIPKDSIESNPTIPTSDTIAVSTQIPGESVTIDNVFLSKPGFVTIHEVNAKGMPGNIIGTSGLLTVGAKQDLEINANTTPGAKYIAMVRVDDGDKKFNTDQDPGLKSFQGCPPQVRFGE